MDKYRVKNVNELEGDIHSVAPHGNMGRINPEWIKDYCELHGYKWCSSGWPYSSGITCSIPNDIWNSVRPSFQERA